MEVLWTQTTELSRQEMAADIRQEETGETEGLNGADVDTPAPILTTADVKTHANGEEGGTKRHLCRFS